MTVHRPHSRSSAISRLSVAGPIALVLFASSANTASARSEEAQAQMDQCQAKAMAAGSVAASAATLALGPIGALAAAGTGAGGVAAGAAAGSALCKDPDVVAAKRDAAIVAKAEASVIASPRSAKPRAELAQTYLKQGRYASAAAAFGDAVTLGDQSSRTLLGLSLAQIANGQTRDAVATLDAAQGTIPAGDLGLALALAGETGRGVSILADAVRSGPASPKLRQNLAYAYALDGRWTEARMTAAVDVSGDQLDSRLEQWASSMRAGGEHQRIAALLGTPIREDAGMPVALALNPQPQAAPVLAQAEPQPAPLPAGELPAAGEPAQAPAMALAVADPAPAAAPAPVAEPAPAPAPVAVATTEYVSNPVVQPLPQPQLHVPRPAREKLAVAPRAVREKPAPAAAVAPVAVSESGSHAVQLGAFSSARNADRAVAWFNAHKSGLAGHKLVVTQARVRGRDFWRVAAAGLDASGAGSLCSSLRQSGGACFAYAVRPASRQPGDKPAHGPALAARR